MISIKKLVYGVLCIFVVGVFYLDFSNIVRYQIEKTFGSPHMFFSNCSIIVEDKNGDDFEDISLFYDNEEPDRSIDLTKYNNPQIYLCGHYINSNEALVISLNGKVLNNVKISKEYRSVWDKFYLERFFKTDIPLKTGKNELILITGNAQERYYIEYQRNNIIWSPQWVE